MSSGQMPCLGCPDPLVGTGPASAGLAAKTLVITPSRQRVWGRFVEKREQMRKQTLKNVPRNTSRVHVR